MMNDVSNPQQAFDSVLEIERDMSQLATNITAFGSVRERQDAVARLTVAAEGSRYIWGTMLQFPPSQLPMRQRFKEVHELMCSRERALQELILRGDFAVGQMVNVSSLVDITIEPIKELVEDLQWLNLVPAIHQFIHRLTEDAPGAGIKQFDPADLEESRVVIPEMKHQDQAAEEATAPEKGTKR